MPRRADHLIGRRWWRSCVATVSPPSHHPPRRPHERESPLVPDRRKSTASPFELDIPAEAVTFPFHHYVEMIKSADGTYHIQRRPLLLLGSSRTHLRSCHRKPFLIMFWFSTLSGALQVPPGGARSARHPRKRSCSNEMSGS